MKNLLFPAVIIGLISACTQPVDTIQELKDDVYFLADDALEGREIGSTGEMKAAEYLAIDLKK